MKIGLPKLRLSRKLLLVTLGITVLLGGTGFAALYFGGKGLLLDGDVNAVGGECTDIQTMVIKTPSNHLWLRKFIRMENTSGHERIRTALRIAGLLAKKNAVDLIHVSVLDAHGPTMRSEMRARSIGADVLIALKPDNLPDMKSPAMASYYEGPVSDQGRYYGDKVVMDIGEIGAMMTAMRTVEDKPDCVSPEPAADEATSKNDHGKKDQKEGHETKSSHEAKPKEAHGEQPANEHGTEPAKQDEAENAHGSEPAKEQTLVDSMLSMVGLGGGEETAAQDNEPASVEPGSKDHAKKPSTEAEESSPGDHEAENANAALDEPAREPSFVDSMLTMVGLGADEAPAEDAAKKHEPAAKDASVEHGAEQPTESHEEAPAAAAHDDKVEAHEEKPSTEVENLAEGEPTPAAEDKSSAHDIAEPVEEQAHTPAKAEDHGETPAEAHDVKAGDHEEQPADVPAAAQDHANPKKAATDEHAEAETPAEH